ncbi:hypothetical protein AXF42_Ash015098 [Apostasia shenzhenica]|uniref:Uncharacterized protein n=1 Tax=Apostasia shenzhenica TaxID=1088818 RepID=A0A2I0B348_9ASPA|nr:hypothetical protein AXF42_Ash015098 [Apostasia shenzhenica]
MKYLWLIGGSLGYCDCAAADWLCACVPLFSVFGILEEFKEARYLGFLLSLPRLTRVSASPIFSPFYSLVLSLLLPSTLDGLLRFSFAADWNPSGDFEIYGPRDP